jgi:hypothetical protein
MRQRSIQLTPELVDASRVIAKMVCPMGSSIPARAQEILDFRASRNGIIYLAPWQTEVLQQLRSRLESRIPEHQAWLDAFADAWEGGE